MEVPRVVATRFMNYLRKQTRTLGGEEASYVHTNERGVCTVDLLAEKRARAGLVVIKSIHKTDATFCERTFYLSPRPADPMSNFSTFVKNHYCDVQSGNGNGNENGYGDDGMELERPPIPFSRVHLCADIMAMDAEDLVPDVYPIINEYYFV